MRVVKGREGKWTEVERADQRRTAGVVDVDVVSRRRAACLTTKIHRRRTEGESHFEEPRQRGDQRQSARSSSLRRSYWRACFLRRGGKRHRSCGLFPARPCSWQRLRSSDAVTAYVGVPLLFAAASSMARTFNMKHAHVGRPWLAGPRRQAGSSLSLS